MDAVELPLPAAVTVSKLMRSDGCGGSARVTLDSPAIDTRSSFVVDERDDKYPINATEQAFWNKMSDMDLYRHGSQLLRFPDEDSPLDQDNRNTGDCLSPRPDAKQSQRKSGKVARSLSQCSKRSRVAHMEASLNITEIADINKMTKEGSFPGKSNIAEKIPTNKQKVNSTGGKRTDKRNSKVLKSKCDSFSLKAGLSSFSSAAGGNNIFGIYSSKADICDFTNHVEELSVNELLDGTYRSPNFVKDKGKKAENLNENIMSSVRKACSVLQLGKKPIPTQNIIDIDGSYNQNATSCLGSSGSSGNSRNDDDKGEAADPLSSEKVQDSCNKLLPPANILDFPLCGPKEILDRLSLPPTKDLDLLLLDAAKSSLASRSNSDPRLGKPVQNRGGLPSFSWSHISGSHSKSNPDAVKLTASRNTCQARWVQLGNSTTSSGDTTAFLADFESLAYDESLVPAACQKLSPTEKGKSSSYPVSFAPFEEGPSATESIASQPPAEHAPRILAAAEILCDIAAHSRKQDPYGMMKWPKKPSQKAMRASKLKLDEKSEKVFATTSSRLCPVYPVRHAGEMFPPKRLRLSTDDKIDAFSRINSIPKSPLNRSTPQSSSRSSPCKTYRDPPSGVKGYNTNTLKKPFTVPPPSRVSNKAPKLRKLIPMDWNRSSGSWTDQNNHKR